MSESTQEQPMITAVIPAYSEEKTIAKVVEGARKHVAQVLVIDDGTKIGGTNSSIRDATLVHARTGQAMGQMGQDSPKVSILIPTLNSGKWIRPVLESIFNLEYDKKDFEVIVIDAMSSDSTIEIAREFDCRILSVRGNVPTAYNHALPLCRGELVAFADSDAIVDRDWLRFLIDRVSERDENVAGVGGKCLTWNRDKLIPRLIGYDCDRRFSRISESHTHFPTMNVVYWKKDLLDIGGFNEKLEVGCDVDIGLRLTAIGREILSEPRAIVFHYQRDDLRSYARQQFVIGRNVPRLLIDRRMRIGKSHIVPASMYAEPVVLMVAFAALVVGWTFYPILIGAAGIMLIGLMALFISRTVETFVGNRAPAAILLPALYTVRLVSWTIGAMWFVLTMGRTSGRGN